MKKFLIGCLVLCLAGAVFAQSMPAGGGKLRRNPSKKQPPGEIGMKVEKFFVGVHENKVFDAFQELLTGSEKLKQKYDINEFIQKTQRALEVYGRMHGYELYDNYRISSRLLYLTYFVYLDTLPLRWRFVYYAPKGKEWRLINISMDDLLDENLLTE